ncbi:hypothetical protein ACLB1R_36105 [Escherichia coli]
MVLSKVTFYMATSDFSLKNHNVKAFGQDAALVIEMNNEDVSSSKPSPFSNEIDNYYSTHCTLLRGTPKKIMTGLKPFCTSKIVDE